MTEPASSLPHAGLALRWNGISVEQVMPGVRRQVVHGEQQSVIRYSYDPGSVFPRHSHPQEQVTVVLSGTLEFELGGETIRLAPGDTLLIPGNLPHGARVIGDMVVDTVSVLSPKREAHPGG